MSSNDGNHAQLICKIIEICGKKSLNICATCFMRFLNLRPLFHSTSFEELWSTSGNNIDEKYVNLIQEFNNNQKLCDACIGLLNFDYIADVTKQIGARIVQQVPVALEEFQLHISLPFILTLRHLYFSKIFDLDPTDDVINVKDVLKTFLSVRIANEINAKHAINSCNVVDLIFTHQQCPTECELLAQTFRGMLGDKKFKSSSSGSFINHTSLFRIFDQLTNDTVDRFDLVKIETNIQCKVSLWKEPLYIAGRYLKYSRNLSQTPWFLNEGEKNINFVSSVQERILSGISQFIKFSDAKFSASGREDVDVRMLGNGRPFLIELFHPQWMISDGVVHLIKRFINDHYEDVKVRDLQFVPKNESQICLKQGEQEKSKTYRALCCLDRPFVEVDANILGSVSNLVICQKTPVRVLHRRTLSDRYRAIQKIWTSPVSIDEIDDEELKPFFSHLFNMFIITEAGTYIKEFVHSDFGRTFPNVSSLLGNCKTDIINLDVLEVKLDWPPILEE